MVAAVMCWLLSSCCCSVLRACVLVCHSDRSAFAFNNVTAGSFWVGDSELFLDKFVQLYRENALPLVPLQQSSVYEG